jgi:UDPglucose--hexose-1-phosphate uridylyltransferase
MYDLASGTGAHEIVIETPEHGIRLSQLPQDQVACVLNAWASRIADLKRDSRIRSVFVFKNQGVLAGAALPSHAHSQVIGLPVTPKALKEILDGAKAHFRLKERCVFCDILREELEAGRRIIATSERFAAIAPFASRHPYECWLLPREHATDFETTESEALLELAGLLKSLLGRLERALPEPAFNLFLYSGPNRDSRPGYWTTLGQDFHWHIAILPRPAQVAGFEVGTGFYSNPVSPEVAAMELRDGLEGAPL